MAQHIYKQHLLDKLRDELISGQSRYTIIRNLRNGAYDWWPESGEKCDTVLYNYVAEAADTCKFETMAARDEAKALHLERYLDQYRKADAANDRTNARAILDSIGKLMGLNEKEKVEIENVSYKIKLV